jgi:serine/threonine protein kinase
MQVPVAANEFLELIEKSGLLSESVLRRVQHKLEIQPNSPAEETAKLLVRERVLTPFQAERLLEGRYRGLVIDRYRIREVLGFGGMGCVFIAEDPDEDRKVAIKVMSTEHSQDPGMLSRLQLEALAGMRLNHPNIIKTYRIGNTGAVHFLVMELVRGISLHELVALYGPLHPHVACDIIIQAAEGLAVAHRQGIIHRDIKPANFLIELDGTARILDFGLALVKGSESEEFSLSMVFGHDCLGTPDYIAPEQTIDSRKIDARADIYALGATFYVALTSHVPFPDKSNKLKLEAHRTRIPRNVCELKPDIPAEIGAIVAKMLAKKPDERYQSMAELIRVLKPFARRKNIPFDFRELVTLRAKQAKAKSDNAVRRQAPRSSITSASGALGGRSHHFSDTDSFHKVETPAIRSAAPETVRRQPRSASSTAPIRSSPHRGPIPSGWRIEIRNTRQRIPLVKSRISIGSSFEADVRLDEPTVDGIQCWLEFNGQHWQMRQESKSRPTYVNGTAEAYRDLAHGSVLKFGGKSSLRLVSIPQQQLNRDRAVRATAIIFVLAVLAAAAWYFLK